MTRPNVHLLDPKRDLVLERVVDVAPELIWIAWTTPEHLKQWFTPAPWTTIDCEIDLRPGGIFRTVMRSPQGQEFPNVGCYLEVVRNKRLVWTNVLGPGYRPFRATASDGTECATLAFTAFISLKRHSKGTKYTALVIHGNEEDCKRHDAMGFHNGWAAALDQLVDVAKNL